MRSGSDRQGIGQFEQFTQGVGTILRANPDPLAGRSSRV